MQNRRRCAWVMGLWLLLGMALSADSAQPATQPAKRPIEAVEGQWSSTYQTAKGRTIERYYVIGPGEHGTQKKVHALTFEPDGPRNDYNLEFTYDGQYLTAGSYTGVSGARLQLSADGNELRGTYGPKDKPIPLVLRRVQVQVKSLKLLRTPDWPKLVDSWQYAAVVGNLPVIRMEITGSGLPILLPPWVDYKRIWFSDPHLKVVRSGRAETPDTMYIEMRLYKGAVPGRKLLHINGTEIEFDLVFKGYQAPKAEEKVRSISLRGIGPREPDSARDDVRMGDWLVATVNYEQPPGDDRKVVTLRVRRRDGSAQSHQVPVRRVDVAQYESDPIRLLSPAKQAEEPVTP